MKKRRAQHAATWLSRALLAVPLIILASVCITAQAIGIAVGNETKTGICPAWPRWENFKAGFINTDGRVIDVGSADARTVSEGQAYGMFFSLVADDRKTFDKLLSWTGDNLAQGDLSAHLPAWLWGRKQDNTWGIIDPHAASDADLWIAYTLLQAGRHWRDDALFKTGQALAQHILSEETAQLPGLGLTLLPGPIGFQTAPNTWRLNPSYVPIQVLRGIGSMLQDQPQWPKLAESSQRLLTGSAMHGFAPDWAQYQTDGGVGVFGADSSGAEVGSYDAIRTYLWVGMLAPGDAAAPILLDTFRPMRDYVAVHGAPPEKADADGGFGPNDGNAGFSAALLPFLLSLGETSLADGQLARIDALEAKSPSPYYGQTLMLFGLGWSEKRFRFQPNGNLNLPGCSVF